jgi:glycosyltransferase involved in cell wall biosynthesis
MTAPVDNPNPAGETGKTAANRWPRLLYLGDVPVESSYHGSALLYRLLQSYPPDHLHVIESMCESLPERRLPQVTYRHRRSVAARGLWSRFHRATSAFLSFTAPWRWRGIGRLLDGFQPQAVLTVAHGYSWLAAAAFARHFALPLHLIAHDDWPRACFDLSPVRQWVDGKFGECYRQAASRLCVSPFMAEDYQRRYGPQGTVLYPCRAAAAETFDAPPDRLRHASQELTVVFAGSVNAPGYRDALRALADGVTRRQGRFVLYGPLKRESTADIHQGRSNVEIRGLVTSQELVQACRKEADVLFVPMSFDARDRAAMEMGFPSKLTDYTAIGLPLLIYGPPYCSAVRWVQENPGVAHVVTEESFEALSAALIDLQEPKRRWELGLAALQCGQEHFDYDRVAPIFFRCLRAVSAR